MGILKPGKLLIRNHKNVSQQHVSIRRMKPLSEIFFDNFSFLIVHVYKCHIIKKNMRKRISDIILCNCGFNTAISWETIFKKDLRLYRPQEKHIIIEIHKFLCQTGNPVKIQFNWIAVKSRQIF